MVPSVGYKQMKRSVNIFVYTQTNASTIHPHALLLVTADIALAMITLSLRCLPGLSLLWSKKILTIAFRKQSQPPKLLRPVLSQSSLPPSWKLTVYRSIVLSILTYAMDSALLSPSQIQIVNTVKSLRRVFKIKPSFYHRVLEPSSADCSNEYLAGLAYDIKRIPTPSQLYSQQRLQLLDHLYRHMYTLEYQVTFRSSHSYRHLLSPNNSIGPAAPAHIGRNPASQRHHTVSHMCSQMIRRDTPTSIMHFSVSHRCDRSVQRMAPVTLSSWTTLLCTGQYRHTPRIERTGGDSCINPVPKGMHNFNPLK